MAATVDYLARHRAVIEATFARAVAEVLADEEPNPLRAIGVKLIAAAEEVDLADTTAAAATTAEGAAPAAAAAEAEPPPQAEPDMDSVEADTEPSSEWSGEAWIESLALHKHVIAALDPALRTAADPFEWARTQLDRPRLAASLGAAGLSGLVEPVLEGVVSLRRQRAAGGQSLSSKFAAEDGTFEMAFGSLQQYHGGLEGLVGAPRFFGGSLRGAMEREHEKEADSDVPFSTSNGMEHTTSRLEYEFVVAPDLPNAAQKYAERGGGFRDRTPHWCRVPLTLDALERRMDEQNALLAAKGHAQLILDECIAGRLYTGACYEKYNAVLRACSGAAVLVDKCRRLCMGNKYPTTLHAINSCVLKQAKLTVATLVYRGFAGATLPAGFWARDAEGVAGGVEFGFMSTTTEREQAAHYAGSASAPTVLEMRQGLVDRGASLSWLSEYPHEEEVLFGPLTGLEALQSRVAGGTLLVEMRLSLNQQALTLEQVLGKRRKLLVEMGENMLLELRASLDERVGIHPGVDCRATGMSPIVGPRYRHTSFFGVDLCEAAYEALPAEGAATDPRQTRSCFERIEPLSAEEAAARCALARAALAPLEARDAAWFNDDANYEAAVRMPVVIKQQLGAGRAAEPPPMLRLLGVGAAAKLAEVDRLSAAAEGGEDAAPGAAAAADAEWRAGLRVLEAVQAVRTDTSSRLRCTRLATCDAYDEAAPQLATMLRLLSEPDAVYLMGRASLRRLPDDLGGCLVYGLEVLDLDGCEQLLELPASLGRLRQLTTLRLGGCARLAALPESVAALGSLQTLELQDCAALVALPSSWAEGPSALLRLKLDRCTSLRALPAACRHERLEYLKMAECAALAELPACWAELPSLLELDLEGCVALTHLPPLELPALHVLRLKRCKKLRALPPLGALGALRILNASDCVVLTTAPDGLGELEHLEILFLQCCEALTALPDLSRLTALKQLYLHECEALEALPAVPRTLPANEFTVPGHLKPAA